MTRLILSDLYLANLRGDFPQGVRGYMSKEAAYISLKEYTGQDFGYNVWKWTWYLQRQKMKRWLLRWFNRNKDQ